MIKGVPLSMSCLADFENDANVVGKRQEMKYIIRKRAILQ